MSNAVHLESKRELFRDDAAYREFVEFLRELSQHDLTAIFSDQDLIGTVLSPEATKEVLYERMLKRIAEKPDLLGEIIDRLENDSTER